MENSDQNFMENNVQNFMENKAQNLIENNAQNLIGEQCLCYYNYWSEMDACGLKYTFVIEHCKDFKYWLNIYWSFGFV